MAVGEFFFRWVESSATTWDDAYAVNDIGLFRFELEQREGEFARLGIVSQNPQIGLLNPSRKQWAWLSWHSPVVGIQPLFFGRVIGAPNDLAGYQIALTFRARPADFKAVKDALAETLKVAPYWDRVWIDADAAQDSDSVLLARAASWHIDRVTHDLTVSDNIVGEDGTLTYDGDDLINDTVSVRYAGASASTVRVRAEVRWTQQAVGVVDVAPQLIEAFRLAGTVHPFMISSYTGGGLVSSWPLPNDDLGGGWKVAGSDVVEGTGKWISKDDELNNVTAMFAPVGTTFSGYSGLNRSLRVRFNLWVLRPTLTLQYDAARSRTEIISFTISADVQALLTDPDDAEVIDINLASNDVSEPVDPDGSAGAETPIGDVRRRSYVQTDRGVQSIEYLIHRARAELLDRARAVEVEFGLPFSEIFNITLRKNAVIQHDMIPGGQAQGKITGYSASVDGATGAATLTVFIACTIGNGASVAAVTGTPDYVEEGYVDSNYQTYSGAHVLLDPGDVTYQDYRNFTPGDDGLNFFDLRARDVVESVIITNGPARQRAITEGFYKDVSEAIKVMSENYTQICLSMTPVNGGPYEQDISLTMSDLMIPKQIDLEAAGI